MDKTCYEERENKRHKYLVNTIPNLHMPLDSLLIVLSATLEENAEFSLMLIYIVHARAAFSLYSTLLQSELPYRDSDKASYH